MSPGLPIVAFLVAGALLRGYGVEGDIAVDGITAIVSKVISGILIAAKAKIQPKVPPESLRSCPKKI